MQLTKEEWSGHVEPWRASGSSAQEYCSRGKLKVSGLRYWSSRIRGEVGAELNEAVEKPRFARVQMRAPETTTGPSGGLFLHVGEVRVEVGADFDAYFDADFDANTLRRVVAVLARRAMIPRDAEVFLALEPVSMHLGFDGLAALVRERMGRSPRDPAPYVFLTKPHPSH